MAGKTIIHGGGQIEGHVQTNSIEAVLTSLAAGERQIELDCVKLADGFAFAHDETEKRFYGIEKTFASTTQDEFQRLRVLERFNPVTFKMVERLLKILPDTKIVIDAKFPDFQFSGFLQFLANNHCSLLNRLYYQVYAREWIDLCRTVGVRKVVVALWKHYDTDPYSDDAYDFARYAASELDALGISVRWKTPGMQVENRHREGMKRLADLSDVYFHGQDISLCREKELLDAGINFFSSYSLGSLPHGFEASSYRKRHADLTRMSDLGAACHYLEFGIREGRRI
jgi:glycerophosphoryl diester phosphodiesterase